MKNEQLIVPTIKQKQNFNYDREQSLEILKMNNTELMSRLKKLLKVILNIIGIHIILTLKSIKNCINRIIH